MSGLELLGHAFWIMAFSGFAIIVLAIMTDRFRMMVRHRLNPFSFRHAARAMNGVYDEPGRVPMLSRRPVWLALILIAIGLCGILGVAIVGMAAAGRG